jgi:hypothetical protein
MKRDAGRGVTLSLGHTKSAHERSNGVMTVLFELLTCQMCVRCGAPMRVEQVDCFQITLACTTCGYRKDVLTQPEWWG